MRYLFSILCFLWLSLPLISKAEEDSLDASAYKYKISLELKSIPFWSTDEDTVRIFLDAPNIPLGGFDFKIQLQSSRFKIVEILPGHFYTDCQWEFFKAIDLLEKTGEKPDQSIWQVIALGEMIADTVKPLCFSSKDPQTELANIIIRKIELSDSNEMKAELNFYWEDCSDNSISGQSGNNLFVSEKVIDYSNGSLVSQNNQFPTVTGTPQNCFRQGGLNTPIRSIEFHHGKIIIDYSVSDDSTTSNK